MFSVTHVWQHPNNGTRKECFTRQSMSFCDIWYKVSIIVKVLLLVKFTVSMLSFT